jgi:hypothetical protein
MVKKNAVKIYNNPAIFNKAFAATACFVFGFRQ